jgi:hypothetical protein
MYGFNSQHEAQAQANVLSVRYPENHYEVAPHRYAERSYKPNDIAVTWGVKRYVPYCDEMSWRLDGFVWF